MHRVYIPPVLGIPVKSNSKLPRYRYVYEVLELHKQAINGAWDFVFHKLRLKPDLLNSICNTTDTTLPIIAARQGELYKLTLLRELGADLELSTPNGVTVATAADNISDFYSRLKTQMWVLGNVSNSVSCVY